MKIMDHNLHELAKNGDYKTLEEILNAVSEVDKKPFLNTLDEQEGWSPLHYAIDKGQLDVVRLLLQHGTDPNLQDKYAVLLMEWAIEKTRGVPRAYELAVELVQCLLEYGADPTKRIGWRCIPLESAINVGNFQAVYCLLEPLHKKRENR